MAEQSFFTSTRNPIQSDFVSDVASLEVDVHNGEAAVFALEPAWRHLYKQNYIDTPFCRFEWFASWWKHFGSQLESGATAAHLLAITVKQAGQLVGIASFFHYSYPWHSTEVRCLRPVGVLGYRHSDLTEEPILLMAKGLEDEIIEVVKAKLLELLPKFDLVQVHYVAKEETKPEVPCRKRMLLKHGSWHESTPMMAINLEPTWEEFLAGQSPKSQEHIRRKPRALAKRCEKWSMDLATPEETEWAVDELIRLHRTRAEAAKGRTIHIVSREHRLFYREYFRQMAEAGLGGVFVLRADDKVIAAQSVLFSEHDWLLFHQGHDPEWSQVSPPVILQMESFRKAVVAGVGKIRLHRFAQEWKLRWGAKPDGFFDQWMAMKRSPLSILRTAKYSMDQKSLDIPEDEINSLQG